MSASNCLTVSVNHHSLKDDAYSCNLDQLRPLLPLHLLLILPPLIDLGPHLLKLVLQVFYEAFVLHPAKYISKVKRLSKNAP